MKMTPTFIHHLNENNFNRDQLTQDIMNNLSSSQQTELLRLFINQEVDKKLGELSKNYEDYNKINLKTLHIVLAQRLLKKIIFNKAKIEVGELLNA